jgi:hypothetical protein
MARRTRKKPRQPSKAFVHDRKYRDDAEALAINKVRDAGAVRRWLPLLRYDLAASSKSPALL